MNILFWLLFASVFICIIASIRASSIRNYRRSNMWEALAYVLISLLLVIAVLGNKGLISW